MSNPNPPAPPESQQIQQVINDVSKTIPPQQGMPLEVTLTTGEVFKGSTPQELLDRMKTAKEEATRTIQSDRERIRQLEEQLRQAQTPPPDANAEAKRAEMAQYYDLWAKNPDEATKQQITKLFGVSPETLRQKIAKAAVQDASSEFEARFPNYPHSPQSNAIMRQRLEARFGTGVDAVTADNLELVYNELVREGRLVPGAMPATQNMAPNAPLSNLHGSSAPPNPVNDAVAAFYALPVDKMKEALEKMASMGVR